MNRSRRPILGLTATSVLASTGCTHWGATEVYGPQQEVARRPLGAPQIAETSSSSLEAGFLGASQSDGRGTTVMSGGLSGGSQSMKRTHCVQQAELDYVQPFDVVPEESGRFLDVSGGIGLGLLGLVVVGAGSVANDTVFEPGDPFYEPPTSTTPYYAVGGLLIAGGLAWIIGSYAALPSGPMPAVTHSEKRWTATTFVEATGCGLVPADRGPAHDPGHDRDPGYDAVPAGDDVEGRLRRLDELRRSGVITEQEYQRKRKEILDQL